MKIQTTRFGEIDFPEEVILEFPEGILGFPNDRQFVLLEHDVVEQSYRRPLGNGIGRRWLRRQAEAEHAQEEVLSLAVRVRGPLLGIVVVVDAERPIESHQVVLDVSRPAFPHVHVAQHARPDVTDGEPRAEHRERAQRAAAEVRE